MKQQINNVSTFNKKGKLIVIANVITDDLLDIKAFAQPFYEQGYKLTRLMYNVKLGIINASLKLS